MNSLWNYNRLYITKLLGFTVLVKSRSLNSTLRRARENKIRNMRVNPKKGTLINKRVKPKKRTLINKRMQPTTTCKQIKKGDRQECTPLLKTRSTTEPFAFLHCVSWFLFFWPSKVKNYPISFLFKSYLMYRLAYLSCTYSYQYCLLLLRLTLRPLLFNLRMPPVQSPSSSSSSSSPPALVMYPDFRFFLGVGRFRFIFAV